MYSDADQEKKLLSISKAIGKLSLVPEDGSSETCWSDETLKFGSQLLALGNRIYDRKHNIKLLFYWLCS